MYPNNHDMDELFRRAASRYPLDTTGSNWENVAGKLAVARKPAINRGYYRGRKYYALLFLIPVAFLFHNSTLNTVNPVEKNSSPALAEKQPVQKSNDSPPGEPSVSEAPEKNVTVPDIVQEDKNFRAAFPKLSTNEAAINIDIKIPETPVAAPKQAAPQKGLYLGAMAGIDFGSVKGQRFTDAGYNLGLLAGYRFNKHWSIETGISWITKKYFTRGEHFSMKKIADNMPGGMEMMAVKGRLSMLEIPYKLKYDFLLKERSNFFIAAGASTNIYIKEDNEYHTRLNGIPDMQKSTYRDFHCAPLCLMHVSAGYEHIFRNKNRLRLEPYVKFPLRKVGMGSVPVLSAGLNLSISDFY